MFVNRTWAWHFGRGIVNPVDDMGDLGEASSIWPSIYPSILQQVLAHRSTIIFCNGRRQTERLAARFPQSRITAVSAKKQRELGQAIKRARHIGLLPFLVK